MKDGKTKIIERKRRMIRKRISRKPTTNRQPPPNPELPPNDSIDKFPDEVYGDTEIPDRKRLRA